MRSGLLMRLVAATATMVVALAQSPFPSLQLHYGSYAIRFAADGTLQIEGKEWKPFIGTWTAEGNELTVRTSGGIRDCGDAIGRYRFLVDRMTVRLDVIADECNARRMVLRDSTWDPPGTKRPSAAR